MTLRAFVGQLIAILAMAVAMPASADTHDEVQTSWRLLDYIAVDYIEAVEDGKVTNELEYAEMQEFSASVVERMAALPANAQRAQLVADAEALAEAISAKVEPAVVARDARRLASELIAAFPVPLAPDAVPDLARGAALYAQSCASCHGVSGDGAGPAAEGLDPPPIAFDDVARARERSAFALYQVIGQGLEGTAMPGFSDLPAEDRWSLAYYSGSIAFPEVERGRRIWNDEPAIRARIPDLAALSGLTPAALGEAIGTERADAVMAYLRAHPEAVASDTTGSLALARERLQQSLAAYEAGNKTEARELALSAYLDGFEPLEAVLSTRDADLLASVEIGMAELRAAISRGDPVAAVAEKVNALDVLFYRAETVLAPANASEASAFLGAFAILLREGLEALLIVIAMIAFLRKAERTEVLPFVHGGWLSALGAGALTWVAATYLIGVSGAGRELVEGFGSLFAALVLLSVGIWMHGKSQAGEWQRYIRKTMQHALSRRSAWFLFGLAFLVVYREVFETILFFAALWSQGHTDAILAGAAAAIVLLALIAWAMLRYSRRLPIGTFFAYSSVLIGILAVVLAGKGISGLQEAGLLGITPLPNLPRIPILGIAPALEPVAAQILTLALIALGYWRNRMKGMQSGTPQAETG
ncbi:MULTISPECIES: cytochrome c/FTR1 family iron permease [Qipengyuania]|jgi:high-affinity iron transporter|uniref:Iron permease n=1 Tax=Qipengyuania citrea LAMA 915 TaxID=1306953 RepID=A0A0L1KDU4_9SPHN|nr:cytochrome c/FTR1 family iron permease [Qipengyuania citrea]MCZ4264364.1 cytochrome c/FTR1 family iron permease [Erythrobacter sp. G21629-S1]RZP18187.1 MAG: c-type cytochrome [Erythrobacter sp.]KNH02113.1 iron permease [Qipengyuania citrea LAMA 915]MCD1589568.1 FTR1 family protein [Qipengyuania citrea]HCY02565.1 iron permease [Erythrobacter sp.]|tara:strand:- start:727 stop:2667 length:1941 start_codon:yes stop_codon:yes gene_type:complete